MTSWRSLLPLAMASGTLGLASAATALLLLLVPQRLAQRPLHQGVLALHVAPDGGIHLWNHPVARSELEPLLLQARRGRPWLRVRLIPEPATPWGQVLQLLHQLEARGVSLELQLPSG